MSSFSQLYRNLGVIPKSFSKFDLSSGISCSLAFAQLQASSQSLKGKAQKSIDNYKEDDKGQDSRGCLASKEFSMSKIRP